MYIVILLALLTALVIIYRTTPHVGGSLKDRGHIRNPEKHGEPSYIRQYKELDAINNVLNRPVKPGQKDINNLQASNLQPGIEHELSGGYAQWDEGTSAATLADEKVDSTLKVLVEDRQPFFLDGALIIHKDGQKFYWDARYPREPVSLDFAEHPDKYVAEHPTVYPSYVISSRDYSGLKPHDPLGDSLNDISAMLYEIMFR